MKIRPRLQHRWSVLWLAALVHRLSGLALAIFLPFHFLALGLAIDGEAQLERFLRWSDQPLVKLSEGGLVFLVLIHMLGGIRLLVLENSDWRDGQKQIATIAAGLSAIVAFVLLIAAWSIVSGCLMLAAAMRTKQARWWLVLGGAAALLYGILMILAPLSGAVVLTWWLGAFALVFGAALIILSLKLRSRYSGRPEVAAPRPVS